MTYRRQRQAAIRRLRKLEAKDPYHWIKAYTEILNYLGRPFQAKSKAWFSRPLAARLP